MSVSPDTMRALLVGCMAGMALLAALYLRRRELSTGAFILWGLLALLVPLLGPFLVILNHPGHQRLSLRQPRMRHFNRASLIAIRIRRLRNRQVLR
jgi:hypothetical protein